MGLTPLEGLVMGTRSGDLDPAIIDYIAQKENLNTKEVINILNKNQVCSESQGFLAILEIY